ncbi:MAG: hypothetical protein M3Q65_12880, partial [Chloroflexota bacterium]|nr:hypothetical protein [Chloroflexota bacterium]
TTTAATTTAATTTAATTAAGTAAGAAPVRPTAAFNRGANITLLQWSSFVPAGDQKIKELAAQWGRDVGANVTIETINGNDLPTRTAAAVQNNSGPDIIQVQYNQPWLYENAAADVSREADYWRRSTAASTRASRRCRASTVSGARSPTPSCRMRSPTAPTGCASPPAATGSRRRPTSCWRRSGN